MTKYRFDIDRSKLVELYEDGVSVKDIAARFHCAQNVIYNELHRNNIVVVRKSVSKIKPISSRPIEKQCDWDGCDTTVLVHSVGRIPRYCVEHKKSLKYKQHNERGRELYQQDIEQSRLIGRNKYHQYKNPEKQRAVRKERYENDPPFRENLRRRHREYNKRTLANSKRRAKIRHAPVVEKVDRFIVANNNNWICQICFLPIDSTITYVYDPGYLHIDHKLPLSKGGEHSYANCQASHALCNWKKNNRTD